VGGFSEQWLQDLLFEHPQCLPIDEVEPGYEGLVPVCRELRTPVGPLDILFCTPRGQLCVVEVKLWRNPEARRKVVGQILDYATEMSRWSYEDLQREVSRATGHRGNVLHSLVAGRHPEVEEARFVDCVSRSLRSGDFLLLVVGDGIREGVGRIANYLAGTNSLAFTFGLVELAMYRMDDDRVLVQPRVLASTAIVQRSIVSVSDASLVVEDAGSNPDEAAEERQPSESQVFYQEFWAEFVSGLVLDDVEQPMAKIHGRGNLFFPLPPSAGQAWLSVYFHRATASVGVYFTMMRGDFADMAFECLRADAEEIDQELGGDVQWTSEEGKHVITCSRDFDDPWSRDHRADIKAFFAETVNRFVNTFRPRMVRIVSAMG